MGTDNDHKGHEEEGLIGSMGDTHALVRKNTTPREAAASLLSSYFSKRFMSGWYVFGSIAASAKGSFGVRGSDLPIRQALRIPGFDASFELLLVSYDLWMQCNAISCCRHSLRYMVDSGIL